MTSLLDTVERLAAHVPQPFVAPIFSKQDWMDIYTVQDDIPYWFQAYNVEAGWHICTPKGGKHQMLLTVEPETPPYHLIGEYLEKLQRFLVITCMPLDDDSWLVVPFNQADAHQRGWEYGEPRRLHLTRQHNLEPLRIIVARNLSGQLLYHEPDTRLGLSSALAEINPLKPDNVQSRNVCNACMVIQQQYEQQRKRTKTELTEDEIKHQLNFVGAELKSWIKGHQGNLNITYQFQGRERTIIVTNKFRGVSAGVCMAGREYRQDVSGMVLALDRAITDHPYYNERHLL